MREEVCNSGGQHDLLENINKTYVLGLGFVWEEKAKLLKACLDIAILAEMSHRVAMSGPDVIAFLEKHYLVRVSPGTVYPVLFRMEKRGFIKVMPNRRNRFYVLADAGRTALENIQQRMEEVQSFINSLVNR